VASRSRALVAAMLLAIVQACGGSAGTMSPTVPPLPEDFPLGAWTVTITEDDLRDAGITDPGMLAENTGVFTKTYAADGTWTVAQETDAPIRWPVFRGTYQAIAPNEIEEVTSFPEDYAGDVVRFRWAREGQNVRFTVVDPPDPILPILTETHPWQPAA